MPKKKITAPATDETISVADAFDRAVMVKLFEERGPQTKDTLLAAGISLESQARNVAWVAEQVKFREAA
ncbi:hypothetical protein [Rhizobium sp. 768_B6_N1_8]|uniref:hypothetical protein n=1 Tax=unclassified Rhizobium TaxID=2613769 RepID=UPI003F2695B2